LPRERDRGTIQRQRGLFGRRSVLESQGAPSPQEPKPADRPKRKPPAGGPVRPRRRTGSVAFVLLGAAAVGVGGGWAVDRWTRPACDPALDPSCQQQRSWGSGGSSGGGSSSRSSSSGSGGSWFSWSNDSGGAAAVPGSARPDTAKRGGFGAIGRFFSSGG